MSTNAPAALKSHRRSGGCSHPTTLRLTSDTNRRAFFLCRLRKLAPDTATNQADPANAIPRFCDHLAKPYSVPRIASHISVPSRTSLSWHSIARTLSRSAILPRQVCGPHTRRSEDVFTSSAWPADRERISSCAKSKPFTSHEQAPSSQHHRKGPLGEAERRFRCHAAPRTLPCRNGGSWGRSSRLSPATTS